MLAFLALGMLRQVDQEFKASLDYVRACLTHIDKSDLGIIAPESAFPPPLCSLLAE